MQRRSVFLRANRFEHACDFSDLVVWRVREHVAIKMDDTSLPSSLRKELRCGFNQAAAGIGDDQLHAFESAILQMTQKTRASPQDLPSRPQRA